MMILITYFRVSWRNMPDERRSEFEVTLNLVKKKVTSRYNKTKSRDNIINYRKTKKPSS